MRPLSNVVDVKLRVDHTGRPAYPAPRAAQQRRAGSAASLSDGGGGLCVCGADVLSLLGDL
jgi:hypothetical protein